ncbi:PREDICTED: tRNA:m(4)X modification enzyme TRM13 homolog [Acropora digitifera]|uniref:tRNA:m(4)X modification enzyme TRM13 homolog n=1 Tax=Acropora digitifera TaxID=70779 RepID=UPI00077AC606|nr:PREDICTED: tRNA:m(4)X modification enzyme TRM13 homolog [Acropora digitifera]
MDSIKMADGPEKNRDLKHCAFFLKRKQRFCRMTVGEGKNYCGEHMIIAGEAESDGRKRITCPLDKKHTVFEDQLSNHLKKCNQTKKTKVVYYSANINTGILNYVFSPDEKVSLKTVSKDKVLQLIEKVKKYHKAQVPVIPHEVLLHSIFQEEMKEMADNPTVLKHLKQQASLIGHMDNLDLLKSNTVFMEFGAGRGKLSHWLQMAVGNSAENVDYVLIDRANNRYKYDRYHRGKDQGPSFQRLNLDIEHLDLSKSTLVPSLIHHREKILKVTSAPDQEYPIANCVGIRSLYEGGLLKSILARGFLRYLADLTLRCLMETSSRDRKSRLIEGEENSGDRESKRLKLASNTGQIKGAVLALCCHHCCSWPQYVGRPFLQSLGFTAEDFHLLCCLSSWATCGMRLKKHLRENVGMTVDQTVKDSDAGFDSYNDENHDTKAISEEVIPQDFKESQGKKEESQEDDRWSNYSLLEREEIGRQCKRLIDAGRLWYLESRDFCARLALYVNSTVSLENVVLLATPKS